MALRTPVDVATNAAARYRLIREAQVPKKETAPTLTTPEPPLGVLGKPRCDLAEGSRYDSLICEPQEPHLKDTTWPDVRKGLSWEIVRAHFPIGGVA
jgi:hypothetical protein